MSLLLGTGIDQVLVAGGLDAPDAISRRRAVRLLLHGFWIYERDVEHGKNKPVRGWRGDVFDALEQLHPAAAAHLSEHQDAHATWLKYGADPEMGDEVAP